VRQEKINSSILFCHSPFIELARTFSVGSIPFHEDYVPTVVCGAFYLQCLPKFGCCIPPPPCKALEKLTCDPKAAKPVSAETMDRDKPEEPAVDREKEEE
jgi:hypothetical protein